MSDCKNCMEYGFPCLNCEDEKLQHCKSCVKICYNIAGMFFCGILFLEMLYPGFLRY